MPAVTEMINQLANAKEEEALKLCDQGVLDRTTEPVSLSGWMRRAATVANRCLFVDVLAQVRIAIQRWVDILDRSEQYLRTLPVFEETLPEAKRLSCGLGADLIFIYLPHRHSALQKQHEHTREPVIAAVKRAGIPLLDMTPIFQRHSNPANLFVEHYSPAGNKLVTNATVNLVAERRQAHARLCR